MKITSAPSPGGPNANGLRIVKVLREYMGLPIKDAKRILDRVRGGEEIEVLQVVRGSKLELLNELVGLGCAVSIAGDLDAPAAPPSREQVAEVNEDMLFADGLDGALIGYVERYVQPPLDVYDKAKVLDLLMEEMDCDEGCGEPGCEHVYLMAQEHFDFNVIGAWMGEHTPAFVTFVRPE